MLHLSRHVLRLFALSLALPETYFDHVATHPGGVARLLHYPGTDGLEQGFEAAGAVETVGIRPHCDFECFTILLQSQSSGLQVLSPDGSWVDAQPIQDTFVMNIGEIMTRMTNGLYKSTIHRVVQKSKTERYSIPFFFSVNYDAVVGPLPSCVTAETPAKFPSITAGEYIIERLKLAVRHNE
ncbi:putative 2-oxoglutarate-dependent dioxygenase [Tolypocladium ophioglossoides CBS 100239]|uniref:Putative 2-oxoglutarate-dependent dioxygenase n=1 Tax=Tolypocladium ophioglossoides (strain CBS 100239) TaxID=1163406 RepID=A0A0L0N3A5_TOLOC|nr:putative 2-oxoglutarate-dependent dioxygenase [Tolypocladium ophioglossoides CBS 100239]